MVQSKAKGNLWENDLLRQLRVVDPMSHKTLGSGNSKDDKGDLACLHFLIEAKHHKSLTKKQIDAFWEKICAEAKPLSKSPLLIFKENNKAPIVMMMMQGTTGVRYMMYWEEYYDLLKEVHCG